MTSSMINEGAKLALMQKMEACEQAPGLSILRHGQLVRDRYIELIGHLRDGRPLKNQWRLPDWAANPLAIQNLPPDDVMATYHLFHDCGKPDVLTVDEDGRRHFPGHAEASAIAWMDAGGDPRVGALIAQDMDIFLLKDEGVPAFAKRLEATALMLTGLAEIHANASMFGGMESTSFKIKWKQLDKRGRAILRELEKARELESCS